MRGREGKRRKRVLGVRDKERGFVVVAAPAGIREIPDSRAARLFLGNL